MVFLILYPGHIRYLEVARSFGSKLIVASVSKLASENQNLKQFLPIKIEHLELPHYHQ